MSVNSNFSDSIKMDAIDMAKTVAIQSAALAGISADQNAMINSRIAAQLVDSFQDPKALQNVLESELNTAAIMALSLEIQAVEKYKLSIQDANTIDYYKSQGVLNNNYQSDQLQKKKDQDAFINLTQEWTSLESVYRREGLYLGPELRGTKDEDYTKNLHIDLPKETIKPQASSSKSDTMKKNGLLWPEDMWNNINANAGDFPSPELEYNPTVSPYVTDDINNANWSTNENGLSSDEKLLPGWISVDSIANGKAIGIFNLNDQYQKITINWSDLSLPKNQKVRDLWRQKNEGSFTNSFSVKVSPHGVSLIKVTN